jgi:mono/diheme cytochrome c family protein
MTKKLFLLAASLALTATVSARAWAQDAKSMYDDKCASCHGPGGKGDGPAASALTPAPAPFEKALAGKSDDWIAKATKEGGPAVGLSPTMPPFSDLTDDQAKSLIAYVKSLK